MTTPTPAPFDLIAHLTDVLGWVKRKPGDVIESGTPYAIDYKHGTRSHCPDGVRHPFTAYGGNVIYTPPPPVPSPIDLIPIGRENAEVLEVNGVVGTYWQEGMLDGVYRPSLVGDGDIFVCHRDSVEVVTEVRILADDDVAVKRDVLKSILEAPESGLTNRDHDELVAALAKAGDPS